MRIIERRGVRAHGRCVLEKGSRGLDCVGGTCGALAEDKQSVLYERKE